MKGRYRLSVSAWMLVVVSSCGIADNTPDRVLHEESVFERATIPSWHIQSAPEIQIGGTRAGDGHDLSGVAGALLLDHEIVVADRGSARIMWFDSTGSLTRPAGGRGQGPGEFQLIAGLFALPSGDVVAYDERLFRATQFDSAGGLVGTHTLDLSPMRSLQPEAIGALESSIVFRDLIPESDRRDQPAGLFADSAFIMSVPLPGPSHRIVALHARDALLLHEDGGRSAAPVLFGGEKLVATAPSSVAILDSATGELQLLDHAGEVKHQVVLTAPTLTLRSEWVEAAKDSLVAAAEERWRPFASRIGEETVSRAIEIQRKTIDATPVAESAPAFSHLIADACNQIWIGENVAPGVPHRRWLILDQHLEPKARIETEAGTQILAIDCNRVAVRSQDALGVEEISVFRIMR